MTLLAIETATEICSAALVREGVLLSHRDLSERNIHSEKLLPLIDEIVKEAAMKFHDVDAIAVSIGPGSFTGLRIGLSAAKGLAMAAGLPLVPVPTLDALALEFSRKNSAANAIVCPLIDAKRDEAFFAFYSVQNSIVVLKSEYEIAPVQAIFQKAKEYSTVFFVGDGAAKMKTVSAEHDGFQFRGDVVCSAVSVALLAEKKFSELKVDEYSMLEPLYLREFVATTPRGAMPGTTHSSTQTIVHSS